MCTIDVRDAASPAPSCRAWSRRSPNVTEVLRVLYLRGISTKYSEPAVAEFFGSDAGLSASTIQRLTREWTAEAGAFRQRDLSPVDYVYLWADGVHFNIRLEEDRLCCLVLIGVRADGHKELVAIGDGFRESVESSSELLRALKRRGMRAPLLAIGDGALGFWGAVREVFRDAREQRCWVHKIANVLDAVPSSLRPKVKAALHNIMNAENKEAADLAIDEFEATYGAKYTKAVDKVLKDREVLLTHFDFPAEHWIHLRTTNVIESTFATVRLRTNKTTGSGSRTAGLAMAFKLLDGPWLAGAASTHPTSSHSFAPGRHSWMGSSSSATSSTPRDLTPIRSTTFDNFSLWSEVQGE